jgi:site-specific DNA-methyltransferase (adenine-specific)
MLIEAFSRRKDHVLDPFCGSGSTLVAARRLDRFATGIELDAGFAKAAEQRLTDEVQRPIRAA